MVRLGSRDLDRSAAFYADPLGFDEVASAPGTRCFAAGPARILVTEVGPGGSRRRARGRIDVDDLQHETQWTADSAYADSKLAMTAIAFAVARRYPSVRRNAVNPGWLRTKMSGNAAPQGVGGRAARRAAPPTP